MLKGSGYYCTIRLVFIQSQEDREAEREREGEGEGEGEGGLIFSAPIDLNIL